METITMNKYVWRKLTQGVSNMCTDYEVESQF